MTERPGRPPTEQWWTINGEDMLAAMRRCHAGEDPELVYLEELANSTTEDHGAGD